MPHISSLYFKVAAIFLVFSLAAGLQMSISGAHTITGAHAHAALVGWVGSALFGTYFALEPAKAVTRLAWTQFWVATLSAAVMILSLYLLLLGQAWAETFVAAGAIGYLAGALLFALAVFVEVEAHPAGHHHRPA